MVMSQSLFIFIKKQFPNSKIDVLAPNWSKGILERMPEVNKCIELPIKHKEFKFAIRRQISKNLREKSYDRAYILPNSWKSALIPFLQKYQLELALKASLAIG